ncbi:hypothetical protein BGZ95_010295 [Linnemannia exigua]|uniref:Uncharacterized protein n=1 Tax=Linnemannia exigua TaxID=604196 RepID=A0AAD4DK88_9FUNG|nr:hypothetical protein BGZ95_010295 [Linnemannia exigua]
MDTELPIPDPFREYDRPHGNKGKKRDAEWGVLEKTVLVNLYEDHCTDFINAKIEKRAGVLSQHKTKKKSNKNIPSLKDTELALLTKSWLERAKSPINFKRFVAAVRTELRSSYLTEDMVRKKSEKVSLTFGGKSSESLQPRWEETMGNVIVRSQHVPKGSERMRSAAASHFSSISSTSNLLKRTGQSGTGENGGCMDVGEDKGNDGDGDKDDKDDEDAKYSDWTFTRTSNMLLTPWFPDKTLTSDATVLGQNIILLEKENQTKKAKDLRNILSAEAFRFFIARNLGANSGQQDDNNKDKENVSVERPFWQDVSDHSEEWEARLAVLTQAIRKMISSEPPPTQGNRLVTIESELAEFVVLPTTAALEAELKDILVAKINNETPADRITGNHAAMNMLLQSPSLKRPVDASYVKRASKGIKPTAAECFIVATLYGSLAYPSSMANSVRDIRSLARFDTNRKTKSKKRFPAATDWVQEIPNVNADTGLAEEITKAELNLEEAESKLKILRAELEPLREAKHFTKDRKPESGPDPETSSQPLNPRRHPTWDRPQLEDYAERLRLTHLKARDTRTITLGSFDPGIAKMLQRSKMTLRDVAARLNIFQLLQDEDADTDRNNAAVLGPDAQNISTADRSDSHSHSYIATEDQHEEFISHHSYITQVPEPPPIATAPPATTTSATRINHLSYMNKAARRRTGRLTLQWRSSHQNVSNNSITHLLSIPELDQVQNKRMSIRSALRDFERNKPIMKDH